VLVVNAQTEAWQAALSAVEQEQRRMVQFGIGQEELNREIEEMRASLKAMVAAAGTRAPDDLADEIVDAVSEDSVLTTSASDLAAFEATAKDLRAQTVSTALSRLFKGQGPLVFMTSPKPVDGGDKTLLAAFTNSQKRPVMAPSVTAAIAWPYNTFGTPGTPTSTRDITDLDTTFITYANGVRLTVKPTKFHDDEVLVRINVAGGRIALPKDKPSLAWAANAYMEGGLKQISAEDMERVLAARVYGGRFTITDDALVLSGETRPADLDIQLQLLAAYLTEPGWRPEAFQRLKQVGATIHDQYEATDSGVLSRDLAGLLHDGDARWMFPSRDEIAAANLEDFKHLLAPTLANGPIEVVIVGDITVEKASNLVAQTFGALPPRAEPGVLSATQRAVGFPGPTAQPRVLTHKGRADQTVGFMAWPTTDFYADPQEARTSDVMADVLSLRLLQELRENQGSTYSPRVGSSRSQVWSGWGYVSANVEVPAPKLDSFFADVRKIAADMRSNPPTADELARAKKPRLEGIEKSRQTNGYWLNELSGAQGDPRRIDAIRSLLPAVERVTAQDVKNAAQKILRDESLWMLAIKPEAK
jgi:zinc protease